MIVYDLK